MPANVIKTAVGVISQCLETNLPRCDVNSNMLLLLNSQTAGQRLFVLRSDRMII